jgi:hypothetical protein
MLCLQVLPHIEESDFYVDAQRVYVDIAND